ncbi:MAG: amidinotransferase, partial [Flavobacteriaceae bacterium]|nr:amidinotransferase [Flavobacteriaceae bacterium]
MLQLNITNETSRLRAVVLGTAESVGPIPTLEEAYDPKSIENIIAGTYPTEEQMVIELDAVEKVLLKYGVEVYRPKIIEDYNQIFTRDIAFVIDDKFIKSNILPDRDRELEALNHVINKIDLSKVITLPQECHVEGGDVMPWYDFLFVGTYTSDDYPEFITARTNKEAVEALRNMFTNKKVKSFEL